MRKIKLGDKVSEFSLTDTKGKIFEYKHDRKRILVIAFLSAGQKQSKSAVNDITRILADPQIKAGPLDLVGVMTSPPEDDLKPAFPILLDSKYELWGKLGIIAMPTVLIVGKDGSLSWIEAGHSYDFAPALSSHLRFALGIAGEAAPEETIEARALSNNTTSSRVKRHLRMAKILVGKGRLDSAIAEVRKAQALDPDSVEPALELGELFCRAGKSKEALKAVEKVKTVARRDTVRRLVICGWARRQMGNLQPAQEDLLEATKLDPKSARGHFELGRLYLAKGDKDKALAAYHRALTLVFGED
ncbi:MAG: tetratricopeptide repeat protein [Phycisphaerales bacterium]|nr:MAG: tetratricopeptide repeat protein [Phycisphaerales bacterium]